MENTLLNLIPAAYLPEIHLSQYDVGRTITFTLKDGASDYSVPSGASVKVKATKPSGFGFEVACTFNGGTVTLVTTDTMTPENGRFPAELSIVNGNTTIGTSNFIFNIERSPHPEGTIDGDAETIIPELTLLVERIEAAAEDVDEKAELFLNLSAEAETLPAGSLATANYSDGVLTLGIPRGYDGDDTKADAIVKSASGEVASFTDGGNGLLVKSLNVNITPKQSGSGDPSPSNVRPISGYSDVNVYRMGKNLCGALELGSLSESKAIGSTYAQVMGSTSTTRARTVNPIPTKNQDITISADWSNYSVCLAAFDEDCLYLGRTDGFRGWGTQTFTINWANTYYIGLAVKRADEGTMTEADFTNCKLQVEFGSTATPYEPYNGTSYPISLGQTVYGGTLEVMSGKLTIDRVKESINGTVLDAFGTSGGINFVRGSVSQTSTQSISKTITDKYRVLYNLADNSFVWLTGRYFRVYSNSFTDLASTKTLFNQNPLEVCYELATPTEITLTPTQVKTLLGNNNIFADSGTVEVEYRADTTLAYNELLSLIASLS